jgi:hypothetical protein
LSFPIRLLVVIPQRSGGICCSRLSHSRTAIGSENIFENPGKFSPTKKCRSSTTIYHAIHHNFTTIYHHRTPQERQNPLQNGSSPQKHFSNSQPKNLSG